MLYTVDVLFGMSPGWSEDFSEAPAWWDWDGDWQWGAPTVGPAPRLGDNLMATKLGGNYSNDLTSYLVSPPLDLRNLTAPVVQLKHWYDLEEYYDYALVGASAGDHFEIVAAFNGRDRQWRSHNINLLPFAGAQEPVYLYFILDTDESENYPGWYIDGLSLVGRHKTEIYFSNFEAGNGGWAVGTESVNNSWAWGAPTAVGPASAYSGTKLWGSGLSGNYLNNAFAWIERTFNLSGLDNAFLEFYHWYNIQDNKDFGLVGYIDGEYIYVLSEYTGTKQNWSKVTVSLQEPIDKGLNNVTLVFLLWTNESITRSGWYVDDVGVYTLADSGPEAVFSEQSLPGGQISGEELTIIDPEKHLARSKRLKFLLENLEPPATPSSKAGPGLRLSSLSEAQPLFQPLGEPLRHYLPVEATLTVLETGVSADSDPADGTFSFSHLSTGGNEMTLRLEAPCYWPLELPFALADQETLDLGDLLLTENSVISGRVLAEDAEWPGEYIPVAATLTVLETGLSASADPSDGTFLFHHLHTGGAEMTLRISAAGYIAALYSFTMAEMETLNLGDIVLESAGYGDINADGRIDVGDAILVLRHIVGLIDLEAEFGSGALQRAKVSGSEEPVNVGDAILILRYIVGLVKEFPVESQ
jgi:hypothetical protein